MFAGEGNNSPLNTTACKYHST